MIVFDLSCNNGHRFEGWFGSSEDFTAQTDRGLVACPQCDSLDVGKAPMAPSVPRKGNQQVAPSRQEAVPAENEGKVMANGPMPAEVHKALERLAQAQTKALKNSKWVGKDFADTSRAIHYGERDNEAIHGEASMDEARKLIDEGIEVAPLPFPIAPPEDLN